MKEPVTISLPAAEAEALFFFVTERRDLWEQVAKDFGVTDASHFLSELRRGHFAAVQSHFKNRRKAS